MLNFAANISLMFQEWSLLDRFAAARDAGFAAIEIQFPYEVGPDSLARAKQQSGLEVVLINAPLLSPDHPAGSACRPEQIDRFRASLPLVREYAEALGAKLVNVLAGTLQPGDDPQSCRRILADNLLDADEVLSGAGIGILLEAINPHDVPGYLIDSFEAARAVLQTVPNAALLQLDLYRAGRMGRSLGSVLADWTLPIGHVQFADAPGRNEPGTGSLPLEGDLDLLVDHGYSGWISAEYRPSGPTLSGLEWLPRWQKRYGNARNGE